MNPGSQAPQPADAAHRGPEREAEPSGSRLELPEAAAELLGIVRYVTSDDGPLRAPDPTDVSPWHERDLLRALERLEVVDHYLRGRVAFFVAGKDHGYGPFEEELELARAALHTCRATARVVDALLAGRLPTEPQLAAMGAASEKLHPAITALLDTGR